MSDVRPAFVFLREDGETDNDAVARCAEEVLAPGPMGNGLRTEDYASFLDVFGHGKSLVGVSTSCAMFGGGCCIHAGAQDPRPRPKAPAITTWLGVKGFKEDDPDTEDLIEGAWIPIEDLTDGPIRGDIFYICSTAGRIGLGNGKFYEWTTWTAAADGHVGVVTVGEGWLWRTAEGGGSPKGTGCRMSAAPKDIRRLSKPTRGVWRPNQMRAT